MVKFYTKLLVNDQVVDSGMLLDTNVVWLAYPGYYPFINPVISSW